MPAIRLDASPSSGFERSGSGAAPVQPHILFVPGINGSGPHHWQSRWQRELVRTARVQQSDWDRPNLGDWLVNLVEDVRAHPGCILVAHSLGCILVSHLVRLTKARGVIGAMLVAPADVDEESRVARLAPGFGPAPRTRFPMPTTVVASRSDPYIRFDRAWDFAQAWGAEFCDAGAAGHINVDSGHGPWSEGRAVLDSLAIRAGASGLATAFS